MEEQGFQPLVAKSMETAQFGETMVMMAVDGSNNKHRN